MSKDDNKPRMRQAVLVAVHGDGYLEVFANQNIDVRIVRMPVAHTLRGEQIAEDCFELMLPRRWRDIWRRDHLRSNGSTAPLTAEAALKALAARDCIAGLAPFMPPKPSKKGAAA